MIDMEMAVMNSANKSPEGAPDRTAVDVLPIKALPFSNGVLKRQIHQSHHHRHHLSSAANSSVVSYKECLKNHAASLGAHALDGCGEFMPSPSATSSDPASLKCAACGCHRNFHRREPDDSFPALTTHVIEFQPHHRHHPPPPPQPIGRSPNSESPPPISSSYYPSAPHMLLALSAGLSAPPEISPAANRCSNGRKRFRTRFTADQKEKMHQFAESMGWRMQKRDEEVIQEFCNEIGIDKGVLKVWMHNNKNSSSKKDVNGGTNIPELQNSNIGGHINLYDDDDERVHAAINASSSSS